MARGRRAVPTLAQEEILDPDTGASVAAGRGRIPELHALGLELKDIQDRSMEWRKKDAEKRQEIARAMGELEVEEYDEDGVSLWLEKGKERVKVSVKAPEEGF